MPPVRRAFRRECIQCDILVPAVPNNRHGAKLKALLNAADKRTIPDLWDAVGVAIDEFTPAECRNYLAAAGYDAI